MTDESAAAEAATGGPAILIAAISGRALAESARRGGFRPLVADFFGDQDTLRAACAHVRLASGLARGIEQQALIDALNTLCGRHQPIGVVYGSGFEDRPQLLQRVAEHWRLYGNNATTVAKIKNPEVFSSLCADLAIPFPEMSWVTPLAPEDWLAKRAGGAGGAHIQPAAQPDRSRAGIYYQRKVAGTPTSAFFLADGERACVLGFTTQWASPTPKKPYRYGGAVRPAALSSWTIDALTAAVQKLAAAMSLVGLNSADFLVDGESLYLLEVNPRPGATLDLFEQPEGSLFALHVAACSGTLVATPHRHEGAKAAAIVYAERDIPSVPAIDWPQWTADRPRAGIAIRADEPICTVYACGAAAAEARTLADERRDLVLAWTRARQ